MSEVRIDDLNEDNFDERIVNWPRPVLVDFWASWCRPCKVIAPILDELAREMAGKADVAKINVDENGDLAHRFGIRSIPTLVLFKNGKVVDQIVGAAPKSQLRSLLLRHVG